jgi:hypothetical protein
MTVLVRRLLGPIFKGPMVRRSATRFSKKLNRWFRP